MGVMGKIGGFGGKNHQKHILQPILAMFGHG
jgi:hypothetical protein